jgi:hypothetical protein
MLCTIYSLNVCFWPKETRQMLRTEPFDAQLIIYFRLPVPTHSRYQNRPAGCSGTQRFDYGRECW